MSAKNLRKLVRLTINRRVVAHAWQPAERIAVNPLHIVEVWPDIHRGVCRGAVVYVRGRPRDGIYVRERLATVERRVREALGGA
jgi:hypothetical protein